VIHIHQKKYSVMYMYIVHLVENQLAESDEEDATSTLIENLPEREIADQNMEITATEENKRLSECSSKGTSRKISGSNE